MSAAYDPRAAGANCDACQLCGVGIAPKCVPPKGSSTARVAFVGEGPGLNEMKKLEPFVGASGIKLDEILWHAGMKRSEVFISNAILCRPEVPHLEGKERFNVELYMQWIEGENKKRRAAAKKAKTQPQLLVDPFTACKRRLLREIYNLELNARAAGAPNGVVVVPLGNFALKVLRGVTGITKWRGSVMLPRETDFTELIQTAHAVFTGGH